jgi:ribosomal protein S17
MFFPEREKCWALDPESSTKVGDIVLIRKNPEEKRPTSLVQFVVEKIIFQHGNIIDPVTKTNAM